jgi:branched-chain amino acid transport system ATP-binding protein
MTAPTTGPPLLDVAGLRVTYGGVVAVSDVNLQVTEGTIYGLIGPNGAGKTSMVDALTGYTRPAAGRIVFDGRDIGALRPYRRARLGLARTFQSVELFDDLTVDENLLVASERVTVGSALRDLFLPHRPPDRTGVDWAISVCGLEDIADRKPSEISLGHEREAPAGEEVGRHAADRLA